MPETNIKKFITQIVSCLSVHL